MNTNLKSFLSILLFCSIFLSCKKDEFTNIDANQKDESPKIKSQYHARSSTAFENFVVDELSNEDIKNLATEVGELHNAAINDVQDNNTIITIDTLEVWEMMRQFNINYWNDTSISNNQKFPTTQILNSDVFDLATSYPATLDTDIKNFFYELNHIIISSEDAETMRSAAKDFIDDVLASELTNKSKLMLASAMEIGYNSFVLWSENSAENSESQMKTLNTSYLGWLGENDEFNPILTNCTSSRFFISWYVLVDIYYMCVQHDILVMIYPTLDDDKLWKWAWYDGQVHSFTDYTGHWSSI